MYYGKTKRWTDLHRLQRLRTVRKEIAKRLQRMLAKGWHLSDPVTPTDKRTWTMDKKMLARLYAERHDLESKL